MTDLVIKGCTEKEAEMFRNIHRAICMNIKAGIEIDLSGNKDNFSYVYTKIHPDNATKLVKYEDLRTESEKTQ